MNVMNEGNIVYVCEKCGTGLRQSADKHKVTCAALPSAEEIAEMMDAKRTNTCSSIARDYRTNMYRIRNILLRGDTHWTAKKLRRRGKKAKYIPQVGAKRTYTTGRIDYRRGRFDCAGGCGMLVAKVGQVCQFCHFDREGLRHYSDFAGQSVEELRRSAPDFVYFQPVN